MALTVDEVLKEIGGYGRYQIVLLQLVGLNEFTLLAFQVMITTFIAGEPTWECVSNSTICNITGAVETTSDDYSARCNMPRSEWKFSDTYTSTVTEFELVCSKSILQNVTSSVFWLGWLLGNLIFGHVADKIGRRKAIYLGVILVTAVSWVIVWPKYLSVYTLCRVLAGFGGAGASMSSFVLLVEYSGVSHRSWAGTNMWYYAPICFMFMSLLAYLVREWRRLMFYGAIMGLPALVVTWFLPESCRFLLVNKRQDDALKQLKTVARWNKKTMPNVDLKLPKEIADEKSDVRDLFYDRRITSITLASWISWFCCSLVYYTVTYGSIYLGGNMYLNFFLVTLMNIPSTLTSILCMNKFGRRKSVVAGLVVAAVASVAHVVIPSNRANKGATAGRILMALVCQYSILISFNTIYVFSSELFPTSVRTIGMGTSSACARIGSFLALYVVWLIRIHALLPYSIVGGLCFLTGLVCFRYLPETLNKPTPETMASVVKTGQPANQESEAADLVPEGKEKIMMNDLKENKDSKRDEELALV